jgi:predicted nucleotidyltransferase
MTLAKMKKQFKQRILDTRNYYDQKKTDMFGVNMEDVKDYIEQTYGVDVLFIVVTGSHMFGTNGPTSDLDIRGVYAKPTEMELSIYSGQDTINASKILDGEVDLQFYEIKKLLKMLLNANGNVIEMLLAPTVFYKYNKIDWTQIAKKSLSKQLLKYYSGYANGQRKRAAKTRGGKALVYAYREIMCGIWLARTKDIIFDFNVLRKKFQQYYSWSSPIFEWASVNKDTLVEESVWEEFIKDWEVLENWFKDEISTSPLPKDVDNYSYFNEILLDTRKKFRD